MLIAPPLNMPRAGVDTLVRIVDQALARTDTHYRLEPKHGSV
jgi:hypothetical protein